MIVTEESVVIERPIEEVFAFFHDPGNVTRYAKNVVSYQHVSGDCGEVGAVVHHVVKVAGRRLDVTEELTGVEQDKYLRRRGVDTPAPFETEIRFAPAGAEGTRVTWHQESGKFGGLLGKIPDGIVAKLYARNAHSNLENAKTVLEA
ncbi:hypothetical protein MLGJGCBP_03748 [Rhodococcus sp. T7]|nr:hypothetical protein MLGJGCBP_03748 [Rhodococcus sp. T7]